MLTKSIETFQNPHYSLNRGYPQQLLPREGIPIWIPQHLLAQSVALPTSTKTVTTNTKN